jgi:eukaryotic-like serine/threonine-protein kinase
MAKVFTITEGLENLGALKTGGQGSVYKARRIGEILTAIKILPTPIHSESTDDKNFAAFQNEVQKLKKVNEEPNPNVVKIISSGITDSGNFPFIEMEFIDGPDLEELLKRPHDPVFTIKEVLKVADQLSSALSHCHKIDVRHGDLKSNNVKYNISTANYVLLDFGLSVMSDEQRRTSIRHAGAIEFMAPEQNDGDVVFQTDVYSFGIILFELLAGRVPFPLNDKGETARNKVMLAHMEIPPPDVLFLREGALPVHWDEKKKKEEMLVPDWLTNAIYKCLEKKPEDRFENGMELHEYIWQHRIQQINKSESRDDAISRLEHENKRLRREKEQLQRQLWELKRLQTSVAPNNSGKTEPVALNEKDTDGIGSKRPERRKRNKLFPVLAAFILLAAIVFFVVESQTFKVLTVKERTPIGEYKVIAPRAYFYGQADKNTRTSSFVVPGNEIIKGFDEKNGFLYSEITGSKATRKGWLRKQDVLTAAEWEKKFKTNNNSDPLKRQITAQLQTAKTFLNSGKTVEALIIYSSLAKQEDPEAMYQYGKLGLQNLNHNVTCIEGFNLVKKAAYKGYTPAIRTLGFLYSFAEDKNRLQRNNYYDRCQFRQNLKKGAKLLMQATLAGDTTASRLLDDLNAATHQIVKSF